MSTGIRGVKVNSTPEYCHQAIEKSLARLGVSYIDLYYIHRLDKVTPVEKTMQAMVELKNAGKIKHIGISECSADSLRRAHAVHPLTALQIEYSAFGRVIESPETKILATTRELGIPIVAYRPMGNGFLTGSLRKTEDFTKPGDLRKAIPWLHEDNFEKNLAVLDQLTEIAKSKGITTAQLALAWLLAQGDDIFGIPGTSKASRLEENLASMSVQLTTEEERRIREIAGQVVGGRVQDFSGYSLADTPPLN